ncbi:MAG TPA: hypothetical protein VL742_08585 [Casimicrobiaceae bacterium]|nr:hypothetical protein [Casimicrobiaceae bacterium]
MHPPNNHRFNLLIVGVTALVTLAIAGLIVNLTGGEKMATRPLSHLYAIGDPQFEPTLGVLLGPEILSGNRYDVYVNGDEIFPPMLAAIRGARRTISFKTYIYWSGEIGQEFADALSERARAGVKVHVLLDWRIGSSKMDKRLLDSMAQAGVEVRRFHRPA